MAEFELYKKEKRNQKSTEELKKGQRRQRRLPEEKKGVQKSVRGKEKGITRKYRK